MSAPLLVCCLLKVPYQLTLFHNAQHGKLTDVNIRKTIIQSNLFEPPSVEDSSSASLFVCLACYKIAIEGSQA